MTNSYFIDTNILVYAFGVLERTGETPRRERAQQLLIGGPEISVQVLNEFTDVCRRKAKREWVEVKDALTVIEELCRPAIPLSRELHRSAVEISIQNGFRIYDSLLIAAAVEAGCDTLYTEDLQHGQTIEGVQIVNPFL